MAYDSPAPRDARIDIATVLAAVWRRLPRILIVTLLLMGITFVLLMFAPRLYQSSASILVEPRSNPYVRASNEQAPTPAADASVVSSQIELIKSRDTLLKVIDQLDLRSEPEFNGAQGGFSPLGMITRLMGRPSAPVSVDETVLTTLYGRLSVVQERDSRLISVIVRSVDPQLAADIANALANAHVARRAQLSISDTAEASSWLLDEIERLRVSVREAEQAVADFKVQNDLFTGQNNTSLLDQQLSTISTQIASAQERKNTAMSRATLIRGLIDRGQPIEGVADVRSSVVIQQLSEEKARLQGEMAQRSATLLSNHPTIRALSAQIGELDNQIAAEGRRVADALEAEAQIEADLEASLKGELARAKASASTATRDTVGLDSLEREAKAQRDLLESYLLRYNEASSRVDTNSALPDVRVVTVAAPAVTPSSPQTSMIMLAVALVSLMVQGGLVIAGELMSGRALAPVSPRQDDGSHWAEDEDDVVPTATRAAPRRFVAIDEGRSRVPAAAEQWNDLRAEDEIVHDIVEEDPLLEADNVDDEVDPVGASTVAHAETTAIASAEEEAALDVEPDFDAEQNVSSPLTAAPDADRPVAERLASLMERYRAMNARHDAAIQATAPRKDPPVVAAVAEDAADVETIARSKDAEESVADEIDVAELMALDGAATAEQALQGDAEDLEFASADAPAPAAEARVDDEASADLELAAAEESVADEPAAEAPVADPAPEPVLAESVVTPAATTGEAARRTPLRYTDLASDLVLGRTHLLLLADHGTTLAGRSVAEDLAGHALSKGLSVALVDAGSGKVTDEPGLSDLSMGVASFGDVVQKSADNSYAEVVWGRSAAIESMSSKPLTLVEALGDIYEVVMVLTGPIGGQSTLDAFAELGGRVVLVMGDEGEADDAEEARRQLLAAGLGQVDIVAQPQFAAA